MGESYLFSTSLVTPAIQETLPEGYKFRPLERSDFKNGHLDVLADLCYMGEITEEMWIERFDLMKRLEGTYYVLVIADEGGKIVGTGTLMVEKKFLYKLATQGHVEDVAIAANQQGKKFGVKLLKALDSVAEQVGCYKTILDCSPNKEGFYVKCGYEKAGSEMHNYYDHEAEEHGV
ncbi:acyl-CoA N-acyltransferase [Tothia fuscella]|uniref:Glucosamine 6-phosphate N-acetyltransferase n=1 Tax=Tothia fuscella TaxID=1048955 RepID=A0A9P4NQ79_9PEZI|nr:acyl-CoA N-acyltransferase [Tothia fuscella]